MEDVGKNLLLGNAKVDILIVRVGTLVDNPIHIQIEIVKLWNLRRKKQNWAYTFDIIQIYSYKVTNIQNICIFLESWKTSVGNKDIVVCLV